MEENLLNVYDDLREKLDILSEASKPKIFYRKFKVKNKIKKRYMIRYNPVTDYMLDNYIFGIKMARRMLKRRSDKNE